MTLRVGVFAAVALVLAPASGFAQQMAPHDDMMMMHGTVLEGTIAHVRHASCGDGPANCQGILEVTPASGDAMMHSSSMSGDHMMMAHPVTVIVFPGQALMYQGSSLPLTRLHAGDHIKLEYQTLGDMNVALSVTMTGMSGMGHT